MTKKIGKIIMITAIVLFFAGIVGSIVYNIAIFTNEYEDFKFCLDNDLIDADIFNRSIKKLAKDAVLKSFYGIIISYISCILLCGYGRLVQDNYEKAQAAKELNDILARKLKEESQNIEE